MYDIFTIYKNFPQNYSELSLFRMTIILISLKSTGVIPNACREICDFVLPLLFNVSSMNLNNLFFSALVESAGCLNSLNPR